MNADECFSDHGLSCVAELRARAETAEAERDAAELALDYSNKARDIMRQEKEHGWHEAEKAESRLEALRDGIQALADEWEAVPYVMYETEAYQDCAYALRALLNPTPEGQETK